MQLRGLCARSQRWCMQICVCLRSCLWIAVAVLLIALTIYAQPQFMVDALAFISSADVLYSFDRAKAGNRCVLTIDDAPSGNTGRILDLLKQYNAKATFFIITGNVKGREDKKNIARMLQEGHEIGNHMTEDFPSLRYTPSNFEHLFLQSDALLRQFTQKSLKWFRPGSGFYTSKMLNSVRKQHYKLVLGNIYPHDPQIRWPWLTAWFLRLRAR